MNNSHLQHKSAHLSLDEYHKQQSECSDLCTISEQIVIENPNLMMCVTCPFCKELVNAELTETTISCPACKVTVNR